MAAFESKKYSWKQGFGYKVSAETVGGVLEKIKSEKGFATSDDFLEYSRSEDAETHSMFEWDDEIAAEKYRHQQSAMIINQLEVEIVYTEIQTDNTPVTIDDTQRVIRTNAFVNIGQRWNPDKTAKAMYVDTVSAMKDAQNRKQVLLNAKRELSAFKNKYLLLQELGKVMDAIDVFLNEYGDE